jgi:hypothetical protein
MLGDFILLHLYAVQRLQARAEQGRPPRERHAARTQIDAQLAARQSVRRRA